MRLSILGPPGSGKSTQAEILSHVLGLRHIYMGELLRQEAERDSPISARICYYLSRGELVPEDVVLAVLERQIAEAGDNYILDGVPRTMAQMLGLEIILSERGESLDAVISLEIGTEEIIRRLLARGRPDDRPDLIARRVRIFHQETDPVIRLYDERGILIRIPADGPPESIADDILRHLRERLSSKAA